MKRFLMIAGLLLSLCNVSLGIAYACTCSGSGGGGCSGTGECSQDTSGQCHCTDAQLELP